MMKKLVLSLLLSLALTSAAYAAEVSPIRVAVIDTGVSTAAIEAEHLAPGRNYIRPQDSTEDKLGHGTAIAGILVGSEAAGVEGLCPEAVLVPLVYATRDENGRTVKGKTDMAAQAVYDAIDVYGCRVINLSSGALTDDPPLREAVKYAETRGVLVVSSAGNSHESSPADIYYPGAYDTVLCVGSVDREGTAPAAFSQRNNSVDLLAPGENLRVLSVKGARIRADGTSFSTAYVTGAAARLLAEAPTLTVAELRELLTSTARDIGPAGYDTDSGWGVLDLDAALAELRGEEPFPFTDVPDGAWYEEGVRYAFENGLMTGTGTDTFSPDLAATRGTIVTMLYRLENSPAAGVAAFDDVADSAWYADTVAWAAEHGIVGGYGNGKFGPDDPITREQMATILYRYAQYKEYDVSKQADLNGYTDTDNISSYAVESLSWANVKGLVTGTSATTLTPGGSATRAQVAVILMRFCCE